MEKKIEQAIGESIGVLESLRNLSPMIKSAAGMIVECFNRDGSVFICGNGGSAADSQHIAAELIGRFKRDRRALPALALSTDTSVLTSLANDYSFDRVFARQVEGWGKPGDVLIMLSTSGNSENVLQAGRAAREKGMKTIALLGGEGGMIKTVSDLSLIVPSRDTARIQEGHTVIYHILCDLVEEAFSG